MGSEADCPEGYREFPKQIFSEKTGGKVVVHSKEEEASHSKSSVGDIPKTSAPTAKP